jgi:hypothetical protein
VAWLIAEAASGHFRPVSIPSCLSTSTFSVVYFSINVVKERSFKSKSLSRRRKRCSLSMITSFIILDERRDSDPFRQS